MAEVPQLVKDAILQTSEPMPPGSEEVRGYDFSNGVDYHALLGSYRTTGFQAGNFGKAVEEINKMVRSKLYITSSVHCIRLGLGRGCLSIRKYN